MTIDLGIPLRDSGVCGTWVLLFDFLFAMVFGRLLVLCCLSLCVSLFTSCKVGYKSTTIIKLTKKEEGS